MFTDSSPVTGEEFQGMIADIVFKNGSLRRLTLPDASLGYCNFDAVSKAVSLLWASWLVAGPSERRMRFFLGKVQSIVTDGGT